MFNTAEKNGFTITEVVAAMVILSIITIGVMTVLTRSLNAAGDLRIKTNAFELAREKMEEVLMQNTVSETVEYGTDEAWPEIQWDKTVESFYEPVTDNMWVRAVCGAEYKDSSGELQRVELTHWITSLSKQQIRQILAQQKLEERYIDDLNFATWLVGREVEYEIQGDAEDPNLTAMVFSGIIRSFEIEGNEILFIIDGYLISLNQIKNVAYLRRMWKAETLFDFNPNEQQNDEPYGQYEDYDEYEQYNQPEGEFGR